MRAKLFLIAGMVVLLVGFLIYAVASGRQGGGVCAKIITKMEAGDVDGSFALLSSETQASTNKDGWKQTVSSVSSFFQNVKPVQKSREQKTSLASGLPEYRETYLVDTPNGDYTVTCYVSSNGKKVNSFSSRLN